MDNVIKSKDNYIQLIIMMVKVQVLIYKIINGCSHLINKNIFIIGMKEKLNQVEKQQKLHKRK